MVRWVECVSFCKMFWGFGAFTICIMLSGIAFVLPSKLKCSHKISDDLVITFRKVSLSRPIDDIHRNPGMCECKPFFWKCWEKEREREKERGHFYFDESSSFGTKSTTVHSNVWYMSTCNLWIGNYLTTEISLCIPHKKTDAIPIGMLLICNFMCFN